MSERICAVIRQHTCAASADTAGRLSPIRNDMATRSSTGRLEQRRAELNKLQTTSQEFKQARSIIPRGTGRDKLWFRSGQYWGKAYTVGLILRYEGLPIADDDACFELPDGSKKKRAWVDMQEESAEPPEERPCKKAAVL